MNAQNVNQILDALAARFGATGAHLWSVLVRQVYVEAAEVALYAVVYAVALRLILKWVRRLQASDNYSDGEELLGIVGGGIFGVVGAILLCTCVSTLTAVFNPEYGAIRLIGKALGVE